ncbi:hypothetical protein BCR36DRAFT_304880, partial [Piromyces finnis]
IFEEGQNKWNSDWLEYSCSVGEYDKIDNGIIIVTLLYMAEFSLQSKTLNSQYGYLTFDFKLEPADNKTIDLLAFDYDGNPADNKTIDLLAFDYDGNNGYDYVNQGRYNYNVCIYTIFSFNNKLKTLIEI